MKRILTLLVILALTVTTVSAASGNVRYTNDAGDLIFQPGSEYSVTDLFPNFKDVMPGDSLTQKITVRNDASDKVKVEIYIRSLGAHPNSEEFLSKLHLRVEKSSDNSMGYMFDAYANEPAQLTDWVCLGMLYSGGTVDLDVILDVPVELGNEYQEQIGYLDWEFMVIEYPIETTDPEPPQTGDDTNLLIPIMAMIISCAALIILLWLRNKEKGRKAV